MPGAACNVAGTCTFSFFPQFRVCSRPTLASVPGGNSYARRVSGRASSLSCSGRHGGMPPVTVIRELSTTPPTMRLARTDDAPGSLSRCDLFATELTASSEVPPSRPPPPPPAIVPEHNHTFGGWVCTRTVLYLADTQARHSIQPCWKPLR